MRYFFKYFPIIRQIFSAFSLRELYSNQEKIRRALLNIRYDDLRLKLGTGGVQGQVKGQRLMGIKAANDSIGLATCQSKIYEK